jgi:hypothetical protein
MGTLCFEEEDERLTFRPLEGSGKALELPEGLRYYAHMRDNLKFCE